VVPCIGYRSAPIDDVPYDDHRGRFVNEEGLISERLYCVGWARRGPTGTIGTNKPDGVGIAKKILEEVSAGSRAGRAGLDKIVRERDLQIVTFADWKKIDEAETAAGDGDAPRVKFASIDDMVKIAES
jgi:ferredoxin--NADP+ reductase